MSIDKPASSLLSNRRRAVVDIGSNSVRLVIFDGPARAPFQICNEKSLCGLGRDMQRTGRLQEQAIDDAMATLARFQQILHAHGNPPCKVVATAAVREAVNGDVFVKRAAGLGFTVSTIDGQKEAALAALGVISCIPDADGLVGDMGGGSLELARVSGGAHHALTSLSIGPFRLMEKSDGDRAKARQLTERALDNVDWLADYQSDHLYAVGGAWRAVARIHMRLRNYHLPILHQYEVPKDDVIGICDLLATQSRKSLEELPGIPRRRVDTLPFASIVLRSVMDRIGARRLVTSAGGVREGLLYEELSAEHRAHDPLKVGTAYLAAKLSPQLEETRAVYDLMCHLFPDCTPSHRRVIETACALVDAAAYFHPDHRGAQVYDLVLRSPLSAISHAERIIAAIALFTRHAGRKSLPEGHLAAHLSFEDQQFAIRLGLALRLAATIAPKAPQLLEGAMLHIEAEQLVLTLPASCKALFLETPRRRFEALASAFDMLGVVTFADA